MRSVHRAYKSDGRFRNPTPEGIVHVLFLDAFLNEYVTERKIIDFNARISCIEILQSLRLQFDNRDVENDKKALASLWQPKQIQLESAINRIAKGGQKRSNRAAIIRSRLVLKTKGIKT